MVAWRKQQARIAYSGAARAVMTTPSLAQKAKPTVLVDNPRLALVRLLEFLYPEPIPPPSVSATALVGEAVTLGAGVSIGDYAYVGRGSVIGDGTVIYPFVYVGNGVTVGSHCRIYPFVCLLDGVLVGDRVTIFPGAVIGRPGFGFVWDQDQLRRMPQVGRVVIESDVEIGSGTCIDRATIKETRIGKGTKIDNLVQVAHNCQIGRLCLIAGQVGMAGSVRVGERVQIGGQAGIADHVSVGDGTVLVARSGLMTDTPPASRWGGYPARLHGQWLRIEASLNRLPELLLVLRHLKEKVEALKQRIDQAEAGTEGGRKGGRGHRGRSKG